MFHTKANDSLILENCGYNILIAGKLTKTEINRIIKPYLLEKNITELDYLISFGEWFEIDKTISELDIPINNLVGSKDYSMLVGDFNVCDMNYINRIVKFSHGRIDFSED
ncbi:MAG: hypothetical protein L6407_06065, partial [Candidatus Delongbacteria bacterium]|nr:hypothetical protein [Candidatus Delongbacteria bacterium]